MYSSHWFSEFSSTIPADAVDREVGALAGLFPTPEYGRLLDVGCGIGRIAGPLSSRGYSVTGIDVNVPALLRAQRDASGPTYLALDQRHIGDFRWRFDGAFILWNSIGFIDRNVDRDTLAGLHRVIRPDGLLALDMYHPEWLRQNVSRPSPQAGQDVRTRRWLEGGRLHNEIEYSGKHIDRIEFEVYRPTELEQLAVSAGFDAFLSMVWWDSSVAPGPSYPRYQMLFRRVPERRA